jgi:hypothetical protein
MVKAIAPPLPNGVGERVGVGIGPGTGDAMGLGVATTCISNGDSTMRGDVDVLIKLTVSTTRRVKLPRISRTSSRIPRGSSVRGLPTLSG